MTASTILELAVEGLLAKRAPPLKEHELKTWPAFYQAMLDGDKPFEARFNDRAYQKGDVLYLREWDPDTKQYTGRNCRKLVTYVLSGWGVQAGHVVMGLREHGPVYGKAVSEKS